MEIIKLIALLLGTVVLLASCSAGDDEEALGYQNGAYETEIYITSDGLTVHGILKGEAPAVSGGGERNVSLCFTEPSSLGGIVASRKDGKVTVTLDGIEIPNAKLSGWLAAAALFDISGDITDISTRENNGKKLTYIEVANGEDTYRISLLSESGFPEEIYGRVGGREILVNVVWFETR